MLSVKNLSGYDDSIANIPGTDIHIYSVLMAIGILLVVFSSWMKMYRRNIPTRTLEGSILIIVPLGLLGARLWYVINNTSLVSNWIDVFAVWNGGLAIEGGVTTGLLVGLFIFYRASRKYQISMWVYLDCILPNILLGQAIGRWGNFFNQELLGADMGHPFSWLPNWMNNHLHYYNDHVEVYRQPLFLYESMCSLSGWLMLTFVVPKAGFWFSKKPWKIAADKHTPLWIEQPITKSDYLKPWIVINKLYKYNKWKQECWEKEYFDFEPDKSNIQNTVFNPLKLIKPTSSANWKQAKTISIKNAFSKTKHKFKFNQDASPLNNSYNPNQYKLTYAGIVGGSYFIFYGIIRMILEPFRDQRDIMMIGGAPTSIIVSALWVILGVTLVVFAQNIARKRFRRKGWFYERQY